MKPNSSPPRRRIDLSAVAEHQGRLLRRVSQRQRLFEVLLGPTGQVEEAAQAAKTADGSPAGARSELALLADRLAEAQKLALQLAEAL